MKINTNMIGNYTPYKVGSTSPAQNSSPVKSALPEKVTGEEKQFFTKLYPENKKEIMDHHFYNNKGKMAGVAVGSLLDRRG